MLVKGQKTTVLARGRSQISLSHVKNYFGAVNSAFFWFTASSGIEGVIYLGGGDRDSARARTQHHFTERCTRISHDLFSISTFFPKKFEQQFFLQWAEHSFLKQRHEVGRKANGGGQTKPIFFFADNPITVRYASNGPPLPAKFFPLVCLGRFPPSLPNRLSYTKLICLPSVEALLLPPSM